MTWLSHAWPQVLSLLWVHLGLSTAAIAASVIIAVPIGYVSARLPRLGQVVTSAAALLYAIPSLPLLVIIPVLFGIPLLSPATVVIALTIYGVALMARTATDAFAAVDPLVRQSAEAIGYSRTGLCLRVDLPLAVPLLIAGARVLCVSTVGLVTIGAVVGISSLGTLFTDGFQRGIIAEVVTGLVLTIALALAFDGVCVLASKAATPWLRKHSRGGGGTPGEPMPAASAARTPGRRTPGVLNASAGPAT